MNRLFTPIALLFLLLVSTACAEVDEQDSREYDEAECIEYTVENNLSNVQCPNGKLWDGI